MSTHPIPHGTVNFPVNMPLALRLDAGRLAFMHDESLGRWVRELIRERVRVARDAGVLDQAGQLVLRLPSMALGAMGIAAVIAQMFSVGSDQVARRVARRGRRRDEVELFCEV